MKVPYVKGELQFNTFVELNRYLVAYFTAAWCGPCEAIKPVIDEIYNDENYKRIQIVKVNIDPNQDLCAKLNIHSVPTFIFYEAGHETGRIQGASSQVKSKIAELNTKASADPQLTERVTEASVKDSKIYAEVKDFITKGFEVLNGSIHTGETIALNVRPHDVEGNVKDVFSMDASNSGVYSDADSQALFFVPLNNISKVYSVLIKTSKPLKITKSDLDEHVLNEECQMPSLVKLWANKPSVLSFDEILTLDAPHVENIETSDECEWIEIKLRYVRFQNVQNLNILIEGDDEDFHTLIEKIVLIGVSGETKEQGSVHQEDV